MLFAFNLRRWLVTKLFGLLNRADRRRRAALRAERRAERLERYRQANLPKLAFRRHVVESLEARTVMDGNPVALDDSYQVAYQTDLSIDAAHGVLAADFDPQGSSLTATVVDQPQHGSLTFNTDGSFSYSPDSGYLGTDSFTYQDSDGVNDSSIAHAYLNISNDNSGSKPWTGTPVVMFSDGQDGTTGAQATFTVTLSASPTEGSLDLSFNGTSETLNFDADESAIQSVVDDIGDGNWTVSGSMAEGGFVISSNTDASYGTTGPWSLSNNSLDADTSSDYSDGEADVAATSATLSVTFPAPAITGGTYEFSVPDLPGVGAVDQVLDYDQAPTVTGWTATGSPAEGSLTLTADSVGPTDWEDDSTWQTSDLTFTSPTISVGSTENLLSENGQFTFTGSDAISITYLSGSNVDLTLSVDQGILTLDANNPALANVSIQGNGTSTVLISGAIDDVNAALDGLVYNPADEFLGTDTLMVVATDDSISDATGSQGISMIVGHADPDWWIAADSNASYLAGADAVALANSVSLGNSIGATTIASATVEITDRQDGEAEALSVDTSGTGIVSDFDEDEGILTLTGVASIETYESVLSSIGYIDELTVPTGTGRTIEYQITDLNGDSASNSIDLAVVTVRAQDNHFNVAVGTPTSFSADQLGTGQTSAVTGVYITSGPTHGTVDCDGSTVTYTPDDGYSGPDSFSYALEVNSALTNVATAGLNVSLAGWVPASYQLTNDGSLTVSATWGLLSELSSTDGVTLRLSGAPQHGILTMQSNGAFSYVPVTGYVGSDSFQVTVTDSEGVQSTQTVELTPAPTALMLNNEVAYNSDTSMVFYLRSTSPATQDTDYHWTLSPVISEDTPRWQSTSGTITMSAGTSVAVATVDLSSASSSPSFASFLIRFSLAADSSHVALASAYGYIQPLDPVTTDDFGDLPIPSISSASFDPATQTGQATISLSQASDSDVTVTYYTRGNESSAQSITFSAGQTAKQIAVAASSIAAVANSILIQSLTATDPSTGLTQTLALDSDRDGTIDWDDPQPPPVAIAAAIPKDTDPADPQKKSKDDDRNDDDCSCTDGNGDPLASALKLSAVTSAGPGVSFDSEADPTTTVSVNYLLPVWQNFGSGTDLPDEIEVQVSFGTNTSSPVNSDPVYYMLARGANPNDPVQLSAQIDTTDLPTGTYDWQMTVTLIYGADPTGDQTRHTVTQTIDGTQQLVNRVGNAVGNAWTWSDLDTLAIQASGASVTLVRADGDAAQFVAAGSVQTDATTDYVSPGGWSETIVRNADGTFTLTNDDGSQEQFDDAGNLTAAIDRNGNTTTYDYDDSTTYGYRLTQITDPYGRTTNVAYDDDAHTVTITDYADHTTILQLDEQGNLQSITEPDPNGSGDTRVTEFTYDSSNGRLLSKTLPSGATTTYTYDSAGRLTSITDPVGNVQYLVAAEATNIPTPTSDLGTWQNPILLQSASRPQTGMRVDAAGNISTYTTDQYGDFTTSTDAAGNQTINEYDANGNLTKSTAANGSVTLYSYNDNGDLLSQISGLTGTSGDYDCSNASATTYIYDSSGNQTSETTGRLPSIDSDGNITYDDTYASTTASTYDSHGNLLTRTTGYGTSSAATITYTYDSHGNALTVTDALGNTTTNTYDQYGNLASTVDALGNETDYTYDIAGHLLTQTVIPAGTSQSLTTTYTYDTAGNQTSVTDALGQVTSNEYDTAGNLTRSTDPLGNVTLNTYDDAGNALSQTVGVVTSGGGDDFSNASTTLNTYDANGNLLSQITGVAGSPGSYDYSNASATTYTYDPLGNQVSVVTGRRPSVDGYGNVSYDDSSALTTLYTYDALGRQTRVTQVVGQLDSPTNGETDDLVTSTTYDVVGNVTSTTDANGNVTRYQYDSQGRQIEVDNPDGSSTSTTYDANGNVASSIDADGNVTSFTYTVTGQVATQTVRPADWSDGDPESTTQYFYDLSGNLTEQIDPIGQTTLYTYDALNRQTSVTIVGGFAPASTSDSAGSDEVDQSVDPADGEFTSGTDEQHDSIETADIDFTQGSDGLITGASTNFTAGADEQHTGVTAASPGFTAGSDDTDTLTDSTTTAPVWTYGIGYVYYPTDLEGLDELVVGGTYQITLQTTNASVTANWIFDGAVGMNTPAAGHFDLYNGVTPASDPTFSGTDANGVDHTSAFNTMIDDVTNGDSLAIEIDVTWPATFSITPAQTAEGGYYSLGSGEFGPDDTPSISGWTLISGTTYNAGSLSFTANTGGSSVGQPSFDDGPLYNVTADATYAQFTITPSQTADSGSWSIGNWSGDANHAPTSFVDHGTTWTLTDGDTYNDGPLTYTAETAGASVVTPSFDDSQLAVAANRTYAGITVTRHQTAAYGTWSISTWSGGPNDAPDTFTDTDGVAWNRSGSSSYNAGGVNYSAQTIGSGPTAPVVDDSGLYNNVTVSATYAQFTITAAQHADGGYWTISGDSTHYSPDEAPTQFTDSHGVVWDLTSEDSDSYNDSLNNPLVYTAETLGSSVSNSPTFDDSHLYYISAPETYASLTITPDQTALGGIWTIGDWTGGPNDAPSSFTDTNGIVWNLTDGTSYNAGALTYTAATAGDVDTEVGFDDSQLNNNLVSTTTYDYAGRVLTQTDPAGHVALNSYDADGNVLSQIAGVTGSTDSYDYSNASAVTYSYDADGRATSVIAGRRPSIDGSGNLSYDDSAASTTLYTYDSQDRETSVTQVVGPITGATTASSAGIDEVDAPVDSADAEFTAGADEQDTGVTAAATDFTPGSDSQPNTVSPADTDFENGTAATSSTITAANVTYTAGVAPFTDGELCTVDFGNGNVFHYYFVASGDGSVISAGQFKFDNNNASGQGDNYVDIAYTDADDNDLTDFYTGIPTGTVTITGSSGHSVVMGTISDNGDYGNRHSLGWSFGSNNDTAAGFTDGELCRVDFGDGNVFDYHFVASGDGDGISAGQFKFDNNDPTGEGDYYIDIAYTDANGNDLTDFYSSIPSGTVTITGLSGFSVVVGTISDNGDYGNRHSLSWSFESLALASTLTIAPQQTASGGTYTINGSVSYGADDTPSLSGWTLASGTTYNAGPLVFVANSSSAYDYSSSFSDTSLYVTIPATSATYTISPTQSATDGTWGIAGWSGDANHAPSSFTDFNGVTWDLTSGTTYNAGALTYTARVTGSVNAPNGFGDDGLYNGMSDPTYASFTVTRHQTATHDTWSIGDWTGGPNDAPTSFSDTDGVTWSLTNGTTYNAGALTYTPDTAGNISAPMVDDSDLYNVTATATYASFSITPTHTADGGTWSLGDPNDGGWSGGPGDAPSQFTDQNGVVWNLTNGSTYNAGALTYGAATQGASVNSAPSFDDSNLYYISTYATYATFTITPNQTALGGTWTIGDWTGGPNDAPSSFTDTNSVVWNLTDGTNYNAGPLTYTAATAGDVDTDVGFDDSQLNNNLVSTTTYDAAGNVATSTDPAGDVTSYTYNAAGQVVSQSYTPAGSSTPLVTTNTYDQVGRLISSTTPSPAGEGGGEGVFVTTTYSYDHNGNILSQTQYVSDSSGNALDSSDPQYLAPRTTSSTYDYAGRVLTSTDANGGVTTFTYDANGNRTSLTDPDGNTTSWTYNYLNEVATQSVVQATGLNSSNAPITTTATTSYTYDSYGQLIEKVDADGRATTYSYNVLGEVLTESWFADSDTSGTPTGSCMYSYDADGNLLSATEFDGSGESATIVSQLAYTYDSLGEVLTVDNNGTPDTAHVVLTATYNAAGERTSLTAAVNGTEDLLDSYTYDALGRLTSVTQTNQSGGNAVADKRVDFQYNALGQFTAITRYSDLSGTEQVATSTYSYDSFGDLTSLTHSIGDTLLAGYGWSFNSFSQGASFSSANDGTVDYSYDVTNQLISVSGDQTASYSYDANGNRTMTGYVTGANNVILSDGTYNYTYDADGSQIGRTDKTTGATTEYVWDNRNRLVEVIDRDSSGQMTQDVCYTYDALNDRIGEQVDTYSAGELVGSAIQKFVFDGDNILFDFSGSSADSLSLAHRYLYGPGTDQILAQENVSDLVSPGTIYWQLSDNLGSVRDLIASDSSLVAHFNYDAYGNLIAAVDSDDEAIADVGSVTRVLYTGRPFDFVTGLQDNRLRPYQPFDGGWIGPDWILFRGGLTKLNAYVGNNPTDETDPFGLEEFSPYAGGIMAPQTPTIQEGSHQQGSLLQKPIVINNTLSGSLAQYQLDIRFDPLIVNVKVYIFCNAGISEDKVRQQLQQANAIWNGNNARIVFNTLSITTLSENASVDMLSNGRTPVEDDYQGIYWDNRANKSSRSGKPLSTSGHVTLFYARTVHTAAGDTPPGVTSSDQSFVLLGTGANGSILAHELGHVLISGSHSWIPWNLMAAGEINTGTNEITMQQGKTARINIIKANYGFVDPKTPWVSPQ